jgi:lysophospholipase L1-like esterase
MEAKATIIDPKTELDFLHDLPVELMWGSGPVTRARLELLRKAVVKLHDGRADSVMPSKVEKFILLPGSCALAILMMEIIIRIFDIPPRPLAPLPVSTYRLSANPIILYEYRPGYKPTDQPFDWSHKGFAINGAGFRDYEYSEQKPRGTYRIVVLGDSTTAGNGIPNLVQIYAKRMEKLLNTPTDTSIRYEVLSMAVGGYHTLQEVETLRTKGLKYNPDMVLVTFCVNDFDLHSDGGVYSRLLDTKKSYLGYYLNPIYDTLLRISRLAFILNYRFNAYLKRGYDEMYITNILKRQTTVKAGLNLLSKLQQEHGFVAIVVILPAFNARFDEYQFSHVHEEVFRSAEDLSGIVVIDLLQSFARVDNNAKKFSYDGIHMNEYGHEVMANILLPIIQKFKAGASQKHFSSDATMREQ